MLSESSCTLALSLIESQLAVNSSDVSLVVAIVVFLAAVANTAKSSANSRKREDQTYTKEQVSTVGTVFL